MDLGLKGKVAIITGGSEGIGKAAAHRLAQEGARVAIVARRQQVLQKAADQITKETGGTVLPVQGDVTRPEDIERVVKTVASTFGGINILVNNAGTSAAGPFEQTTDEQWMADFELKVWAAVRFCRLTIPYMRRAGGGRIINVTNLAAKAPGARSVPTSISRAAGLALTKVLSKELAPDNILVNTVCIGFIKSGQNERRYEKAKAQEPGLTLEEFYQREAKARGIPLGRVGESWEAGDVIAFLASERASYLTGIAVNIDGGLSPVV